MSSDTQGAIWVALLGALVGGSGAVLQAAGINTTDCLVFAAVFGCFAGAMWERPGPGTLGSLAAFGAGVYVLPFIASLAH